MNGEMNGGMNEGMNEGMNGGINEKKSKQERNGKKGKGYRGLMERKR